MRLFATLRGDLKMFNEEKVALMMKRFEGVSSGQELAVGSKVNESSPEFENFSDLLKFSYCVATGACEGALSFAAVDQKIKLDSIIPRSAEDVLIVLYLVQNSKIKADTYIIDFIVQGFFLFNESLPSVAGTYLSRIIINYLKLNNVKKFTDVYEKFISRHQNEYNLSEIYDILRLNNRFLLKYPNDLSSKMERRVSELVLTEKSHNISKIMQIYSACPNSHHFQNLAKNIYRRIEACPEEFLETSSLNYSTTVHYFAKFRYYKKLSTLVERHIPEITEEMKSNMKSLGVFLMAILRFPLTPEYKNMIIKEIFLLSDELEDFRKKKIITTMINDDHEYFWQNVHKLGVTWKEEERCYIEKDFEKLEKMGLISK